SENDCFVIREVNRVIEKAKNCIIITGVGISYSAGIPDFISSDGLYNIIKSQYPGVFRSGKDLFDVQLLKTHETIKGFNIFMGILKELIQFERVKNCKAQVVQLYGTLSKLRCNACTNICLFTLQYCDIFKEGEAPNCPECVER
ncbi:24586_t:CDS:2, partial [Gigaspora margarita]